MLTTSIKQFVDHQIGQYPQLADGPLADWKPEHETQINIDPTGLEPCGKLVDGKLVDDGWLMPCGNRINHIRIPFGAMTPNPTFHDRRISGPVHNYWKWIGSTGWNWGQRKSMWVGFDFDSIDNHESNALNTEQLEEIKNRALSLPYVIARTSKSAKGVHLIVPLNPWITTRTHTEHANLAKYILSRMSHDCDFNFLDSADVCGSILWHWERGLQKNGLIRIT